MLNKSPKTCLLTVTNNCVLRCKMCHLWQLNTAENEVNIDDCKRLIDSFKGFGPEPVEVHIIGGESLIKKGVLDLISHISNKGSRTVMTSCAYTIDETMAKAIAGSGLNMLNISIDSLNPLVHNFLRGRDDSFQRAMSAIDYLSKYKDNRLRLGINTVISAKNLDDIVGLSEWTLGNKNLDSIYFMAVMRPFGSNLDWHWFKKEEYKDLWPLDYSKVELVLDKLITLKNKGSKIGNPASQLEVFKTYFKNPFDFIKVNRCNVSEQALNINALGDVYLCFFMEKLGNIKEHNVAQLWNSDKAQKIRAQMRSCRNNCELVVNCYYEEK
ncbi:MAG: radical SAM protein [Candidatus Omnitrophota bacterium]|nr:radical SAM protein [Candidatus Omnitrophota bacterium]